MRRALFPMSLLRAQGWIGRARVLAKTLAIAAGVLPGCEEKHEAPAPPPPEVQVATVEQKDVPIYSEWIGTMDGNINAQIRARIRGHLQERNYTEGTMVGTGVFLNPGNFAFVENLGRKRAAKDLVVPVAVSEEGAH